jgi:hypothetical protein
MRGIPYTPDMKKKRKLNLGTTDFPSDQSIIIRPLNGFWLLLKITETIYMNAKKVKTEITRCKPSISLLIEPASGSITWYLGQKEEICFPLDWQRSRIVTNEMTDKKRIRANVEFMDNKMKWLFVVNYTPDHYSRFKYEFIRDEE